MSLCIYKRLVKSWNRNEKIGDKDKGEEMVEGDFLFLKAWEGYFANMVEYRNLHESN